MKESLVGAALDGKISVILGKPLPKCKRVRSLIVEGAVGTKPTPITDVEAVGRIITQVRVVQPPPTMVIDGQQFPMMVEGSPRSPRLMMEDRGEHLRCYLEVGGAAIANVWALPGPYLVLRGRIIQLNGQAQPNTLTP